MEGVLVGGEAIRATCLDGVGTVVALYDYREGGARRHRISLTVYATLSVSEAPRDPLQCQPVVNQVRSALGKPGFARINGACTAIVTPRSARFQEPGDCEKHTYDRLFVARAERVHPLMARVLALGILERCVS